MKKIFKSIIFATALLSPAILFNCAEEQLPAGVQLSLVQHRLHIASASATFGYNSNLTQTISVVGENTPWTLTGLPDWLTASTTTGNGAATITLTAKADITGKSVDIAKNELKDDLTIKKGDKITIYRTNGKDTVIFKTADGSYVGLKFEAENKLNGKPLEELFDNLFFAG